MKTYPLPGILLCGLAALLVSPNQSSAADIRYKQSGPWTDEEAVTTSNGWLAPGIPGAADNARANWGNNTITLAYAAPDMNNVQIGVDESGTMEINSGGVLTSILDVLAGNNNAAATGTLTVNDGGIVNVGRILWVANNSSTGVININTGGTVNVVSHLWWGVTGTGTISISGTLNQTGGILGLGTVDAVNPGGGSAAVTIESGGVFALNNIHGGGTSIQPGSSINIKGTGMLTILNDHVGNVNNYITAGYIGGEGVFSDLAALDVTYDGGTNRTIVTAVGAGPGPFVATLTNTGGGGFDLSWPSQTGMLYNVRSSETLTGTVDTWNLVEGNIAAGPPTNTKSLTPVEAALYYAVEEFPIPAPVLLNGSFEDPILAVAGDYGTPGSPWAIEDPGALGLVEVWFPEVGFSYTSIPDGDNVGAVSFSAIPGSPTTFGLKQTLTETFAAGTNYEVTVQVGRSNDWDWPGFRVELWAGGVLLASDEDPTTTAPTADNFITSTVSYDHTSGPAATPGDPLEVRLLSRGVDVESVGSSSGWSVEFDSVTFSSTTP